ncbi:rod shape-determining protein MreD (plasmid) [Paracoccus versutus]|uniref:Rod shape-determining protein MreD n=1 Tax=Paracoccus versutus TaxID=34007 RepID=A0AAQ0KN68_PARVE|nr:rod shape-determining protein MreD [Paracoccus versutus]KGJ10804.1 rod shape-determining protein MreD [Paracoccus versutus]REG55593.1 rod shape-determining protein MreD [Paracoccus versutus]WEJ81769.1 rod shape-determining protein MreD [Paracoccus versutus]
MIDPARRRRFLGQALFVALFLAILFWRLLPLAPGRVGWPGPDLALCLVLVWVLRRPEQVPVATIAALFLIEDILLMRPIGLGAALAVIVTEAARKREPHWRELPFMVEWLRVATLLALMMVANRILLAVFFLPLPPFGQVILQFIATVTAYPLVAGLAGWALGLPRGRAERDTRHR